MNLKTFIFIGRSGCGKGTQVKLLMEDLKKGNTEEEIFYLQTGQHFRDFVKSEGFANKMAKKIMDEGGRQPDFLAVWIWSNAFLENVKNKEHLIIDGTPRSLNEARTLDTAIRFLRRLNPFVVYIDVSRQWSEERLLERGRDDDLDIEEIRKRLDWFEDDVLPAVSFYRDNEDYNFIYVNGEQTIEEVNKEMMKKINS
jgi:adenylate kinase